MLQLSIATKRKRMSINHPSSPTRDKKPRLRRTNTDYVPRKKSGGWGVCYALAEIHHKECGSKPTNKLLTNKFDYYSKQDIITKAQKYCSASYTDTVNCQFTAWDSVHKCEENNLVEIMTKGKNDYVKLTQNGWDMFKPQILAAKPDIKYNFKPITYNGVEYNAFKTEDAAEINNTGMSVSEHSDN